MSELDIGDYLCAKIVAPSQATAQKRRTQKNWKQNYCF